MLWLLFAGIAPAAAAPAQKLAVVASIFPVADMVRQVGGPYLDVNFIVPAGASPHTFEPRPSQVRQIAAARVFFTIGAGLEVWAAKFAAAGGKDLLTVALSDGVSLITTAEGGHDLEAEAPGPPRPGRTGRAIANPHVWLDPVIAAQMTERIITVLCRVDPSHADSYRRRGNAYLKKLAELDRRIRLTVSHFTRKKYVAFHSAWDYFARRYGLESVGTIESAPGRDPTPRRIERIIADIRRYHIRAVFAEPQLNAKVADVIAREAGVKVLLLDPMGGPDLKGRSSYLELMEYDLSILKVAMQ